MTALILLAALAAPPHAFPPPPLAPREDRTASYDVREWYTGKAPVTRPIGRLGLGFSGRAVGPEPAAFSLDLMAGVRFGFERGGPQLGIQLEGGYSLRAPGDEHLFLLGGGLAYGVALSEHGLLALGYLLFEPQTSQLGARGSLMWDFAENGFFVELTYSYLPRPLPGRHDVRAMLGVDLVPLAFLLFADREPVWF